jgi:hypothetical protein
MMIIMMLEFENYNPSDSGKKEILLLIDLWTQPQTSMWTLLHCSGRRHVTRKMQQQQQQQQ